MTNTKLDQNSNIYNKTSMSTTDAAHLQYQSPPYVYKEYGWICPVCGRGCSPSTSYCPCNSNHGPSWINQLPKEIPCVYPQSEPSITSITCSGDPITATSGYIAVEGQMSIDDVLTTTTSATTKSSRK